MKQLATIGKAQGAAAAEFGRDLNCVAPEKLSRKDNPMALDRALAKCIANAEYDRAVVIDLLARAYTEFDSLRVADPTAHGVNGEVLALVLMAVPPDNLKHFDAVRKKTVIDPAGMEKICAGIRKIGHPDYYPQYMVQFGMQAVTGTWPGYRL